MKGIAGSTTHVSGGLRSAANADYLIEFFASDDVDEIADARPTGRRFLAAITVTTDAAGSATFDVDLAAPTEVNELLTATVTDEQGNTSEFSAPVPIVGDVNIQGTVWDDNDQDGVHDPDEPGTPGVPVCAQNDTTGAIFDTITDADGQYEFSGLNPGTYTVFIKLANDDIQTMPVGQFPSPGETVQTASFVRSVASADFDGDGDLDLALTSDLPGSESLILLTNDGRGNFTESNRIRLTGRPHGIAAGDLDGDGDADLAVTMVGPQQPRGTTSNSNRKNDLLLFLNSGGIFPTSPNRTLRVDDGPMDLLATDMDGDQDLDLVVASMRANTVSVWANDGSGNFSVRETVDVGQQPLSLSVGDVNGDGQPDIVVANYLTDSVELLVGGQDGSLTTAGEILTGRGPSFVQLADVDGDGNLDLAAAFFGRTTEDGSFTSEEMVQLVFGNGSGDFGERLDIQLPTNARPESLRFGDLDGDLDIDLAIVESERSIVSIYDNDGGRAFRLDAELDAAQAPEWLVMGEFSGDRYLDLVAPGLDGTVHIMIYAGGVYRVAVPENEPMDLDFGVVLAQSNSPLSTTSSLPSPNQVRAAAHRAESVLDVNGDGVVSPLDALTVINNLGADADTLLLPILRPVDISGNYRVDPLDALLVVNELDGIDELNGNNELAVAGLDTPQAAASGVAIQPDAHDMVSPARTVTADDERNTIDSWRWLASGVVPFEFRPDQMQRDELERSISRHHDSSLLETSGQDGDELVVDAFFGNYFPSQKSD